MLHAMDRVGVPDGTSSYFRLSTRPIDQALAQVPNDEALRERRRRHAVAGGYRLVVHPDRDEDVALVGAGAIMSEVLEAAAILEQDGVIAGVVCLTSPDLVFRLWAARGRVKHSSGSDIVDVLFPPQQSTPLVTVLDGHHPHTLSLLAGVRGDRIQCLGVTESGQSSNVREGLPDPRHRQPVDHRRGDDADRSLRSLRSVTRRQLAGEQQRRIGQVLRPDRTVGHRGVFFGAVTQAPSGPDEDHS